MNNKQSTYAGEQSVIYPVKVEKELLGTGDPFKEFIYVFAKQKRDNLEHNPIHRQEYNYLVDLVKRMETAYLPPTN